MSRTIDLISCPIARTKVSCTDRMVAGPVVFHRGGTTVLATVTRGRSVYASGRAWLVHGRVRLLALTLKGRARHGRYRLTLRARHGRRWTILREEITIS